MHDVVLVCDTTLSRGLYFLQERCGRVVDVKFVPGNQTIACVEFAEAASLHKAVHGLGDPQINKQSVTVRPSLEIRQEMDQNKRGARGVMGPEGPPGSSGGAPAGAAAGAVAAAAARAGAGPPPEAGRKIRIMNLGKESTVGERDVRKLFLLYGEIESVVMNPKTTDLLYKSAQSASDACEAMDGFLFGGQLLQVAQGSEAPPEERAKGPAVLAGRAR